MTNENPNQPPIDTLRDGSIKAAIWKNDGEKGTFYSVEFSRTYTKGDKPASSYSFSGAELLRVSLLAQKSYERIAELKRDEGSQ
jgi:hypothetical protein